MNRLALFTCFLLLASCNYFEKKKVYSEDLLNEELETIDWNAVDTYPSFLSCDSLSVQQARKHCFENTLLDHVNAYLSNQTIVVSEDLQDTIALKLGINKKGFLSVLDVKAKPETHLAIPEMDSLLRNSLNALPKIFPAIKRGQQVDTEFVLPVVISIQ